VSRIVLVTGGGSGLGRAVAGRFRAGGDTVIITGRNTGQLAAHCGGDRRAADRV
jgi:3-oxoacyl-[acyl-carrier protein] reductase